MPTGAEAQNNINRVLPPKTSKLQKTTNTTRDKVLIVDPDNIAFAEALLRIDEEVGPILSSDIDDIDELLDQIPIKK